MLIRDINKIDITVHQYVLVQLWDGLLSGIKCAVFVRKIHKETGERDFRFKEINFFSDKVLVMPEIIWLQGKAAKDFLKQQGYKIVQKSKTIQKI